MPLHTSQATNVYRTELSGDNGSKSKQKIKNIFKTATFVKLKLRLSVAAFMFT